MMSYRGKTGFLGSYKGRDVYGMSWEEFQHRVDYLDYLCKDLYYINDYKDYLIDSQGLIIGELHDSVILYEKCIPYVLVLQSEEEKVEMKEVKAIYVAEIASPKETTKQAEPAESVLKIAETALDYSMYSKVVDDFFKNLK
jgi:hypothetical protein